MKKWLWLVVALVLALGVYVAAGPYLTVRAIRAAVEQQDAQALSKQVDFPALRSSLKAQLGDRLVREAGADVQASTFGAIGLSLANGLIGGVVDTMVTPMGLGAMMEGRKVWRRVDDGLSSPSVAVAPVPDGDDASPTAATPRPFDCAQYRFESLSRFTATVQDDSGRPIQFVMTRDGLQWKLSDIRLPL